MSYSRLTNGTDEFWQTVRVNNPLGILSFTQQFINVGNIEGAGALPSAPQSGTAFTVETNDPRALDAVWRNNQLYGVATLEIPAQAGQTTAGWFNFDADGSSVVALDDSGVIDGEDIAVGTFTFFPSVAVNDDGGIAVGFSASAPTIFPGSYFTTRSPTDTAGTMRSSQTLRAGTDFYNRTFGTTNRWGDYTAMAVDPNDECFWVYNKHAVTRGTSTGPNEDGLYESAFGEICNVTPNAINDAASVDDGMTVTVLAGGNTSVLTNDNDTDPDDTLSASLVTGPSSASSFTLNTNGTFSYTHNGNASTSDFFTYDACDDGTPVECDEATVNITINQTDTPPTAVDDNFTVGEDSGINSLNVTSNDTDPDGGPLNISSVGAASNGTANQNGNNVDYAPNANFCGADSFSYTLNGGSSATVTMDVTCVDDDPVAVDDNFTVGEDSGTNTLNVTGNDTDVDAGPLSISSVGAASNGTANQNGNNVDYAPNANFCGADSFSYTLNGGSSATVTMDVTCVDDDPVAVDDNFTVGEDSGTNTLNVTGNDTDVDAGPLSISSVGAASNGTASQNGNNVDYAPNANFCGADSFSYTLNGGSSATVTMDVTCVDDASVAVNDAYSVLEDSAMNVLNVRDNDMDPDSAVESIVSVTQASNGSVTFNVTSIDYVPDTDFCGNDSFTYDLTGGSSATVDVTVDCVNDQPDFVLDNDVYVSVDDIGSVGPQVVACQFDFGPDNEDLSQSVLDFLVSVDSDPQGILNTVDVMNDGQMTYSFSGNEGSAEISVRLQDDGGTADGGVDTSSSMTITVHVRNYIFRDDFEAQICP